MSGPMWFLLTTLAVTLLTLNVVRLVAADRLAAFSTRRRDSSQLVSRGELIEGNRHLGVALALTESAFIYENSNMHRSLDRRWIQEVGYDNGLASGQRAINGKVLTIRCFGKTFEFVIGSDAARQWEVMLPAQH